MTFPVRPTAAVARNDAHYAVVVGINFYEYLDRLTGPRNDAASFRDWLSNPDGGGLPPANIRTVDASEKPEDRPYIPTLTTIQQTLAAVNEEMRSRLTRELGVFDRSRLYIFVAGHGISAPGSSAALLSSEAGGGLSGQALDLQACSQWYKDHGPFSEVVLFADCCRTLYRDVNPASVNFDSARGARKRFPRVFIAYATVPDEVSWEASITGPPDDRRGYFSLALVEALAKAIDPRSGRVTNFSLEKTVRERVREMTENYPQTCEAEGLFHPPIMFGPEHPDYKVHLEIHVSEEKARRYGTLELELSEDEVARCPSACVGNIWELDIPRGLYRLRWVRDGVITYKERVIDTDEIPAEGLNV